MKALALQVLVFFGFAYVVGHSVISLPLRVWVAKNHYGHFFVKLVECPACLSVHLGWLSVVFGVSAYWSRSLFGAVSAACFFAATSFILGRMTGIIHRPQYRYTYETETHIDDIAPPPQGEDTSKGDGTP